MKGTSIQKSRNKRCDRLTTHVLLYSAKNRIYKQNTHIHKVDLKTLYFNFDSLLQKRFLRSSSRKRLRACLHRGTGPQVGELTRFGG